MAEDMIMEEREELMVSPKHHNPTRKLAHFLKPTSLSTTIRKPISLNPHSLPKTPLKVSLNGFKTLQNGWKDWVNHMHALHKHTWQKAGIYNAHYKKKAF
ncbi:Aminotransferase-like mobile domain-containing protein [Artemisia annua]|uniref:Aminotransferase-like mobile domain-containing protein n=1 Tax=Artemisia annua TaxID=35608 RepID=A0A2U1QP85_ARTAN|nr:Aminotransferase-like mobile domain-containing protein [Artemisia annua]